MEYDLGQGISDRSGSVGGPTNNAPTGTGSNLATPNRGTLVRSRERGPGVQGRDTKPASRPARSQVLAQFDLKNAVIWVNDALLAEIAKARKGGGTLRDEDVATLAHEFAHVWQSREVFDKIEERSARGAALVERRKKLARNSTEQEFVEKVLASERQAELLGQRVVVELLGAFSRSRGGRGFSDDAARMIARERSGDWLEAAKSGYSRNARKAYRSLREPSEPTEKPEKSGGPAKTAPAEETKRATFLPVSRIVSVLPTRRSATLRKLVQIVVGYDMMLVVDGAGFRAPGM